MSLVTCAVCSPAVWARPAAAAEPGLRLDTQAAGHEHDIVLTLDACGGHYDAALIATLVRLQVPATLFVTGTWLARHADAVAQIRRHPQLFEFENHGARHVPAVIGGRVYGMAGPADAAALRRELLEGAQALRRVCSAETHWYRGAGARYDATGMALAAEAGWRIAGYSLNADDGASAAAATVRRRLAAARAGDVILAHMNHPASGTAAGLAEGIPLVLAKGLRFVRLSQALPLATASPTSPLPAP